RSTLTDCRRPDRRRLRSAAASAEAATLACAATPILKEDGKTGPEPVSTTSSRRSSGAPTERQISRRTERAVMGQLDQKFARPHAISDRGWARKQLSTCPTCTSSESLDFRARRVLKRRSKIDPGR